MRSSTPFCPARVWALFRLSMLLVLSTAAGCGSSRTAFQFRPASSVVAYQPGVAPDSGAAASVPTVAPAATPPPARVSRAHRLARAAQVSQRLTKQPLALVAAQAHKPQRVASPSRQRKAFLPQQPREVGLGTTVLGVLGLVVLPISLLGLLIWGGPVWAVLAGLSALAILVAYLDPFQ